MSRLFNGTNQALSRAINLSAHAQVSLSFWLWWDAFANNDDLAFEYTPAFDAAPGFGFLIDPNQSSTAAFLFGFSSTVAPSAKQWLDRFPRPTAAAWHHYVLTMNRATPVNAAFVDGAAQTLTTVTHNAATYGNFANSTLYFMSRAAASLFGAGRMAQVALFGSILTARHALALSSGALPLAIGPVPIAYWPLFGPSPEPDYGGTQKNATLTNAPTLVAHPPVSLPLF